MDNLLRFSSAVCAFGNRVKSFLLKLPKDVCASVEEIRLRLGMPIALTIMGKIFFVTQDSNLTSIYNTHLPKIYKTDIEECFRLICKNSAFAHSHEISEGFVTMENGCRAGICGTLTDSGFIQDITSVNIRIAREFFGTANSIVAHYHGENFLIAGPPGCGKTTLLRDMIRQLSNGAGNKFYKICVIDCRREISGINNGEYINDLGINSDLLITPNKSKGIEIALRTMSPDIIAFDEISKKEELESFRECFFAGVSVITTAHIGSSEELLKRDITSTLIKKEMISKIALMSYEKAREIKIISCKELLGVATI